MKRQTLLSFPPSASLAFPLALAAWFAALVLIVSPLGNFPIADDWAYAASVRWLLEGRLRISEFAGPAAITNIAWGSLFCLPTGFNYTALRVSTIFAAILAIYAFNAVLTHAGQPRSARALACALLAANPIFLSTSYTFQTDVLFLALFLLSCLATMEGVRRASIGRLVVASIVTLLATLSRQIGLVPCLVGMYFLRRNRAKPFAYLALGALPVGGLLLHAIWFRYVQGMTHAQWYHLHESLIRLRDPQRLGVETLARLGAGVQYLGWMLFPAAIGSLPGDLRRAPWDRNKSLRLLAAGGLWLGAWAFAGAIPALGDQVSRLGLGAVPVPGAAFKTAGWWSSLWLWACVNGLSLAGVLLTAYRYDSFFDRKLRLLWVASILAFALALLSFSFFDRYLLLLIPAVAAWIVSKGIQRPVLAWAAAALLAAFSLAGLRDMMSWNDALWRLGAASVQNGQDPDQIMGGLSWDGAHIAEKNLALLRTKKPLEAIQPYEWRDINPFEVMISFSPHAPAATVRSSEIKYSTPFDRRGGTLYLYTRTPLSKGR